MFHIIQDAVCVVRTKHGVYKQCKMYVYNKGLYAGLAGGFVRLMKDGNVGTPDVSWIEFDIPPPHRLSYDPLGRTLIEWGVP